MRRLEHLHLKILKKKQLAVFNQTCLYICVWEYTIYTHCFLENILNYSFYKAYLIIDLQTKIAKPLFIKKKKKFCRYTITLKKARSRRYSTESITDTDYADDLELLANTPAQA